MARARESAFPGPGQTASEVHVGVSLKERLEADMKAALKAGAEGKERLSVIRMARAAIKNAEIDKRHPLSDEEVVEVLAREVKQRRDAIAEFGAAAGREYTAKLEAEIAVLQQYMPEQLSEEQVRELVRAAIAETGASGARDIGKVMGVLMPRTRGRADGKVVNQIARELLGG